MAHILLIDDDPALMPGQVRQAFPAPEHRVEVAVTGTEGLERVAADPPDVILLDLRLPDQPGLEVFRQIRRIDARIPVIFVTIVKGADVAIDAMKEGAFDYLFKPFDPERLRQVLGEALEVARQMRAPAVITEADPDPDVDGTIVGTCPAMLKVYKAIGLVAAQSLAVLITGESGTGKELIVRALYQHSLRAQAPFVAINCAAIPENLLESEMFGHEKGAFTGADRRRIGKFEQCNGGTIFLDEVGDMPLALQAKMLRVLQEQSFERVGGNETIRTDVRLISASHRDLKAWSTEGRFRPDLYYRLSVFTIHLPPLRERGDDLRQLVRYYLPRFSRELGRDLHEIDPEALRLLCSYPWPGNIRELQSVLRQAVLQSRGTTLLPGTLLPLLDATPGPVKSPQPLTGEAGLEAFIDRCLASGGSDLYAEAHRQVDRVLMARLLEEMGGNQVRAARRLGIGRETLRRRLREVGIQLNLRVESEETEAEDG